MKIILNNNSMVPVYEQVVEQIKNEIIQESLKAGEPLPSVRALSGELKISALTVKKAYDRLEEEGFIVTVHGKGSFVENTDRQLAIEARRKAVEDDLAKVVLKAKAVGMDNNEIREIMDILLEE
ncbi:MAG: GntR family transcriptional regulator [Agathobacter sp.]|nr:GntR family transcriptional regulator [Agathobacter sp.]